jgi:hypothetical protein
MYVNLPIDLEQNNLASLHLPCMIFTRHESSFYADSAYHQNEISLSFFENMTQINLDTL